MFFKALLALSAFFTVVSCSYFFGDKKEDNSKYSLTLSEKMGVSCVGENSELMRDYFDMKRDDVEIAKQLREMKTCLNEAIDLFVRHTRGEEVDSYTAADIHEFLDAAFDGYDYPIGMMEEAFRLKDSILGGSPYVATKEEVKKLPLFIDFIYERLAYHAKDRRFLFSKTKDDTKWEGFPAAAGRLEKTIQDLRKLPFKASGQFDYSGMTNLVMYFIGDDDESKEHWTSTFEIVNSLQAFILTGPRDTLDVSRFHFATDNLVKFYLAWIEFQKYLLDDKFFTDMSAVCTFPGMVSRYAKTPEAFAGEKPDILNSIHGKILSGLMNATSAAEGGGVGQEFMAEFIDTIQRIGAMPDYIKAETLKAMMPKFFGLWLSKSNCGDDEACKKVPIRPENIGILHRMMNDWHERQVWINKVAEVRADQIRNKALTDPPKTPNLKSLQDALKKVNHKHWGDYVVIGDKTLTFKDLVIFNKIYTLGELFSRPFNNNDKSTDLLTYYWTEEQAQTFYSWFRPLGLELKVVDPRGRFSGSAAFTEINLFSSISTDPETMDFGEMIEYFEITLSTSLRSVALMENEFKSCRISGLLDVFGFEKLEPTCFRNTFVANYDPFLFVSLPKLKNYVSTHPDADLPELLNFLERAARQGLIADEPMETDTLRMMSSIAQYAESLFLRFDADHNNVITNSEFQTALVHLVPNIRRAIYENLEPYEIKSIESAFEKKFEQYLLMFIIEKKKIPGILTAEISLSDEVGKIEMIAFKEFSKAWEAAGWTTDYKIMREDILLVISALSTYGRVSRYKDIKKIFVDNELEFPIKDSKHLVFDQLAEQLRCSSHIEPMVMQWMYDNQKLYWDDVLSIVRVQTGGTKLFGWDTGVNFDFGFNDLFKPAAPLGGWEDMVTNKLIELVAKDPTMGPLCDLPMREGTHRISRQQDTHESLSCVSLMGMASCQTIPGRTPY